MSIQFGLWNFHGEAVCEQRLANVRAALAKYAYDEATEYSEVDIQLLYLPLLVTPESKSEKQPFIGKSGRILLWDGRLDNRQELMGSLSAELRHDTTDAAVVAAALERWGLAALPKLIGDWALAVWDRQDRSVLLAKDFLGTRPLYYTVRETAFMWSTCIDPLLRSSNHSVRVQEEYLAGWLSHFPATHLTPFAEIHSVPPASYLLFRTGRPAVKRYWDFDPHKRISYRDDREYEEHFRTLFAESVRRRLRSARPVLAELSGGMDSSSVVCMADALMARGFSEIPRLDTVSCFDSAEPNWNEAPFFELVERRRGRAGHHVAADFRNYWHPLFDPQVFAATPGSGKNLNDTVDYEPVFRSGAYRVLLQGIGGDEVLGGVPTPLPELADLLIRARGQAFLRQLIGWALASRRPAFDLLGATFRLFLPDRQPIKLPWLNREFASFHGKSLSGYPCRFRVLGPLPSFQANMASLENLRRHISAFSISPGLRAERRFPYLDRDLLEFAFSIPRNQLVRPGQRRSLMRRALVGIIPEEILNRRRKAFIVRGPLASLRGSLRQLLEDTKNMTLCRLGIVDAGVFREFLKRGAETGGLSIIPALRTLLIEAWLTNLVRWGGSLVETERIARDARELRNGKLALQSFFS